MKIVFADRVKQHTETTGGDTIELLNNNIPSFHTFVTGIGNGNHCYYSMIFNQEEQWEIGIGLVTEGVIDTISRELVLASSDRGLKINFLEGLKDVFVTLPAKYFESLVEDDIRLASTSGTNTGDETTISIITKIGDGLKIDPKYIPASEANDKFYNHIQGTATYEWIINHNLNKFPTVAIIDSANTVIDGNIEYIDNNTCKVTFNGNFSGGAYCN